MNNKSLKDILILLAPIVILGYTLLFISYEPSPELKARAIERHKLDSLNRDKYIRERNRRIEAEKNRPVTRGEMEQYANDRLMRYWILGF